MDLAVRKVPDSEQKEFEMAVQDDNATQGKPFMRTTGPMSEQEVREQLQKWHISEFDIDAAFDKARH
jgi:hypothetical protein